ncbi:MAG: hypothetical protein Kow00114_19930 [Kiloniellaceae bacterium]
MKKFGSGSHATFVSPYLRRPLRPLDKVLSEREERTEDGLVPEAANDEASEYGSATWRLSRNPAALPD